MIKSVLTRAKDKKSLLSHDGYVDNPVLLTSTYGAAEGVFRAVTRAAAGTSTLAAPDGDGAIVLTDLIITTDKVNAATVTIQWTDGVNTIVIVSARVNDAPCNLAIPFAGKWMGWSGARLDVVTVAGVNTTVSAGYFKVPGDKALAYAAWDAKR